MRTEGESLFLQGKLKKAEEVLLTEADTSGRACYFLGLLYRDGYGAVTADEARAESFFRKGKDMGNPLCALALAPSASGQEEWDLLNRWFPQVLCAASAGDVAAMDEAGLFYISGGLFVRFEEGMKWLAKSSLFEYWKGSLDLGKAYGEGIAVPADPNRAFLCYEKAASFRIPEGQYRVGEALLGRGGDDAARGIRLLEEAFEGGSGDAALLLGSFYGSEDSGCADEKKAFEWFRKGADRNHPECWAELAFCYEQGIGCAPDRDEAEACCLRAARLGHEESFFSLGLMKLEDGKDGEAFSAMKQAADTGHPRALYVTGMMYLTGKGTEKDREEGIACLEAAAEQGNEESGQALCRVRAGEL